MKVKFYWVLEKDSELEYIQTDLIMKDNGKKDKERVKVSKFGKLVHFTKEIGRTIKLMDMEG